MPSPTSKHLHRQACGKEVIDEPSTLLALCTPNGKDRANFFRSSMYIDDKQYVSLLIEDRGEYFLEIYIGSPPVSVIVIADTGSSLIWVKCSGDYKAHHFNPPSSSSYETVTYNSKFCKALRKINIGDSNSCEYDYSYRDGSRVLSLVSQLKSQIESKFSYCLLPIGSMKTNKLRFGVGETISNVKVVSTPLVLKDPPTRYYFSLESISIGGKRTISSQSRGNIMIDSGTTLTMLHSKLYNNLETIVKKWISGTPIEDPPKEFKLCHEAKFIRADDLPTMVFHFDGPDIHLQSAHTFMRYHTHVVCMIIVPNDNLLIFRSMAQVNFRVEFYVQNRKGFFR
ncbi:aspartic proteinase CDR1-like [Tripterygium wilfordii]|uniref:aspartic proteinase CDR1-like n=1 Tax=Tripterygium wilfordii TaxID=458696 RepID=UPI0018F81151|nr:aspartic proteinase CDR1-like [Tripterygium wilfordii]